ncbi:bis(5'-nucleosyl)-tetraphosphatase (symmetrical) YqeK [Fictibacillus terranigra]|uniref:bis(5'-nucleosyl)-tetraphosphatase (symmetrical) n=1 Tax=Fictibacillus terranigra TaxID=3058424 RepID=A0ABT8EA86_9BACL|nr:bis(5'-nucleosyl)-tetraphosphatase (symmetrical) YqeK [Fictibacillus sp. CENA-BCM004]MDN4074833.1 bis(5'-nucleosyl)-tetraphosphatase (symmetrical) YqeK [Fictibacillus sp. CENA-BCM004]
MDRERALKIVKEHLTEHRYIHTLGVMETALELADRFGADRHKAELAAIFHDYAKFRSKDEMREVVKQQGMPESLLHYGTELLHAPVGAFLVKQEAGIEDHEILEAIASHTTGRVGMGTLEKIIFLADYIEPGRKFPGVDQVRLLAEENLELACIQALKNTVGFLMKQNQLIYPETIYTYNSLLAEVKNKNVNGGI